MVPFKHNERSRTSAKFSTSARLPLRCAATVRRPAGAVNATGPEPHTVTLHDSATIIVSSPTRRVTQLTSVRTRAQWSQTHRHKRVLHDKASPTSSPPHRSRRRTISNASTPFPTSTPCTSTRRSGVFPSRLVFTWTRVLDSERASQHTLLSSPVGTPSSSLNPVWLLALFAPSKQNRTSYSRRT